MIDQLLGGFLAGLAAVVLYIFFTRTPGDDASLRKHLHRQSPEAGTPRRGIHAADEDSDCNNHSKFHRPGLGTRQTWGTRALGGCR